MTQMMIREQFGRHSRTCRQSGGNVTATGTSDTGIPTRAKTGLRTGLIGHNAASWRQFLLLVLPTPISRPPYNNGPVERIHRTLRQQPYVLDQPLFHTDLLTEISYETPHGKSLEKTSSFPQKVLSTSNRGNSCRELTKETSSDSKSTLRTTLSLSRRKSTIISQTTRHARLSLRPHSSSGSPERRTSDSSRYIQHATRPLESYARSIINYHTFLV
jgi:hypothetical protein